MAERPVEIDRVRRGIPLKPLGDDHLDHIPRDDVLLGLSNQVLECIRRHVGPERGGSFRPGSDRFFGPGGPQKVGQRVDPAESLFVDRQQVFFALSEGAGDDLERVAYVVEDDERVGDEEDGIVGLNAPACSRGELFEVADHLVAEKPHGAPEKTRQTLPGDGSVTAEKLLQNTQGISPVRAPLHRTVFLDDDLVIPHAEGRPQVRPEKAVPPPFLAPLHAFQQEKMGAVGQFHEGRDGGFHIGEDLPEDGDHVSLFCQVCERFKVRSIHGRFLIHPAHHKKRP